jgi:hypothetical protein
VSNARAALPAHRGTAGFPAAWAPEESKGRMRGANVVLTEATAKRLPKRRRYDPGDAGG